MKAGMDGFRLLCQRLSLLLVFQEAIRDGMERKSLTPLRIAVLAAAGFGTLFWIGALAQWWTIADSHRDGLELIGVALATAFFVVLVLPTLAFGIIGRWLPLAAALGVLIVLLGSDTLWPWLP
jgi:hypothetical protein